MSVKRKLMATTFYVQNDTIVAEALKSAINRNNKIIR